MSTIQALIIDDEPLAHRVILEYAKKIDFLEIVGQCYKATDAYHILESQSIDLIFLDINMPRLKGLDFLRTLEKRPLVIVTSAYEEYALEGYELEVNDYLLKPFRYERFLKAVTSVQNKLQQTTSDSNQSAQKLMIKVDKKLMQINAADIQYLESYGNYVKVWIGEKCHLTPRTLTSFEEELDAQYFIRIHKSYLVQRAHIDFIEGNNVMMKNNNALPIGKMHKKKLVEWLR